MNINFAESQNHRETLGVGNDRLQLLLKTIDAKSLSLKLMAALAALFSHFCSYPITSVLVQS